MAATTITEIREAIIAALKNLKVANGYTFDLPDANIQDTYSPRFQDRDEDEDYPRVMLVLDDGTSSDLPSRRREKTLMFFLIAVDKAFLQENETYDLPAEKKAERMLEAVDKLIANSSTLGGKVENITIEGFTTDSGHTHPEATSVIRLLVDYKKQF